MNNDLNAETLTDEIVKFAIEHGLGNCKEYKELHYRVCNATKGVRYRGLMGIYERKLESNSLLVQTFAGRMLLKISPKSLDRPETAIFRLLPNWNVSAEEVIFYLSEQFGKDVLINLINQIRQSSADENIKASLRSMLFWLGAR